VPTTVNAETGAGKKRAGETSLQHLESPLAKRSKSSTKDETTVQTLTSQQEIDHAPLAERLRPRRLEDFVGHGDLVGPDSAMMKLIKSGHMGSVILWGPPGYVFASHHLVK
jgi:replication-associated recombination protein RarA